MPNFTDAEIDSLALSPWGRFNREDIPDNWREIPAPSKVFRRTVDIGKLEQHAAAMRLRNWQNSAKKAPRKPRVKAVELEKHAAKMRERNGKP